MSASRSREKIIDHVQFRDHIWEDGDYREEGPTEEIQMIRSLLEVFCCFFSRSDPWNISTSFLDTFCDFLRIEGDRYVDKRKAENKEKIDQDIEPARIIHRHICDEPFSDIRERTRSLLF